MKSIPWAFLARSFGFILLVIWVATTLVFFIPKLTPRNPLREKLMEAASRSGFIEEGFNEMVASYEERFGLDQPVWKQYLNYMGDIAHGDLGYSIANYPQKVSTLIAQSLPWTIGLLATATIIAFFLGTILGALMAWPKSSAFIRYVLPSFLVLGAIPAYLIGLILVYFLAYKLGWFPTARGFSIGLEPNLSLNFILDVMYHSILPAVALIVTTMGGWVIGMRGMMVTVQGEDYMIFGEAKGLRDKRLFYRYGVRNAILPQVTGLALSFSLLVAGSVLVEIVFQYPGLGGRLYASIKQLDYFMIYGIVLIMVVAIAIAMFIMDLIYPMLDPRITYDDK